MWVRHLFYDVVSTTVDRCLVQASALHPKAMNESQATYQVRSYSFASMATLRKKTGQERNRSLTAGGHLRVKAALSFRFRRPDRARSFSTVFSVKRCFGSSPVDPGYFGIAGACAGTTPFSTLGHCAVVRLASGRPRESPPRASCRKESPVPMRAHPTAPIVVIYLA